MSSSTTVLEWLTASTSALKESGSETPRLDSLILLEDVLKLNRASLLAHPEQKLTPEQGRKLNAKLALRLDHVPLAYIRKKIEFYGRDFFVDERVLVPRPESESIIEELLSIKLPSPSVIADIGTGSGVLGVTAALEIPGSLVDLYDISPGALDIANRNAKSFSLKLKVEESDLLNRLVRPPSVVLANLPYVPDNYPVKEAVQHEPRVALYGGNDGMSFYRDFWKQLASIDSVKIIITESLTNQHEQQAKLAEKAGYRFVKTTELVQVFERR